MTELIKHPEFGEIRTRMIKGEPLFCAADVCKALGLEKVESTLRKLDNDEKGAQTFSTLGGKQELLVVTESGLYALIMRSNKPIAKKFRKWVTSEVLPSIRKNGYYIHPDTAGKKELKKLKSQLADMILDYLTDDDMRKIEKKFGVDRYGIRGAIRGDKPNNAVMQECQRRALINKANEKDSYNPRRMHEVLTKLAK